jgi:hypothetical protein
MKTKIILLVSAVVFGTCTSAYAEERGAWVKVDGQGNAIGQAIVCTQSVCGNSDSLYNQMTLGNNERYVLQNPATADGNVAGVGAGQGRDSVKVDLETKVWTITNETKLINPISKEVTGVQTTVETYDRTLQNPIETKVSISPITNTNTTVNNSNTMNHYAKVMAEYQIWLEKFNQWFLSLFGYKLGGTR